MSKLVRDDPFEVLNRHVSVSRETFERLTIYHDLLIKWQAKINLVSNDSLADAWQRHFLDSAQLINHIPHDSQHIADLGSGAGFPGMAIAILTGKKIHLVESDGKKISFLQEVTRLTNASVMLHHKRIEEMDGTQKFDVILARGCSELKQLLTYAAHFVSHETTYLFPKGKNYSTELEDAYNEWSFDHAIIPSVTDKAGVIVKLSRVHRRIL